MSDRNEPDWDAMANQRLYAYLASCDPLCEDCECEDPEHAETHFVIAGPEDFEDGTLYWSNDQGWVDLASATRFTEAESKTLNLPLEPEARWERDDEKCTCKCHNIPHDPRDDRPEPDDIPDWYPEGD